MIVSFRYLKSISISKFTRDILATQLITHPPIDLSDWLTLTMLRSPLFFTNMLHSKLKQFELNLLILGHAPALSKLRSGRRHLEKIWFCTRSSHDLKLSRIRVTRNATNSYHSAIIQARRVINSSLISSSSTHPRKLRNSIHKLLHRKPMSQFALNLHLYVGSSLLSSMTKTSFSSQVAYQQHLTLHWT